MGRFLLLLLYFCPLFSGENFHPVSLLELNDRLDGQNIETVGFLYPCGDCWVLASTPDLKTCCLKSPQKAKEQLIITQKLTDEPKLSTIKVRGILKAGPFYTLEEAELIEKAPSSNTLWIAPILLILALAIGRAVRSRLF